MILKCVIIDNEDFAINAIKSVIEKLSLEYPIEIVETFNDSVKAINEINNIDFNLLFIDYEMPGYNGVEFVSKMNQDVPVIFVTSFKEKSIDILNEVDVVGFLTKPPQLHQLKDILKKKDLLIKSQKKINKIIIPNGKNEVYFDKEDIYYIVSDKKSKDIYNKDNKRLKCIDISFDLLVKELSNFGFEKISKSHIVNVDKIRERTKTKIILTNGEKFDIGVSQKLNIVQKLKNWYKN